MSHLCFALWIHRRVVLSLHLNVVRCTWAGTNWGEKWVKIPTTKEMDMIRIIWKTPWWLGHSALYHTCCCLVSPYRRLRRWLLGPLWMLTGMCPLWRCAAVRAEQTEGGLTESQAGGMPQVCLTSLWGNVGGAPVIVRARRSMWQAHFPGSSGQGDSDPGRGPCQQRDPGK